MTEQREITRKEHACMLCSGQSFSTVYKNDALEYLICEKCGFVFLKEQPSIKELGNFYAHGYQNNRHGIVEYEAAIERLKRKNSAANKMDRVMELKPYLSKQTSVFEVGTGYGTFLKVLRDVHGCTVAGIEPADIGSQVAKKYYDLDVEQGTLETVFEQNKDKYANAYDFIIMIHVLEHMGDPRKNLINIKSMLKDNGLVYIAVPNVARPDEALELFFHDEHLSYFSPRTLKDLLQQTGYKIVAFKEKPVEMVMVVAKATSDAVVLPNIDTFDAIYTPAYIRRCLRNHSRKYKVLRTAKACASMLMPKKVITRVTPTMAALFRRLGIIRL